MKQPIGFQLPADPAGEAPGEERRLPRETPAPSVARVYFPQRQMAFLYYNDAFDLRKGDLVYVEGKLAGMLGQVVEVSRTFKIRLADYKRVIGRAQTRLTGEFFHAGAYLLAFDPAALSREAASTWFWPPAPEGEVFASASDGDAFPFREKTIGHRQNAKAFPGIGVILIHGLLPVLVRDGTDFFPFQDKSASVEDFLGGSLGKGNPLSPVDRPVQLMDGGHHLADGIEIELADTRHQIELVSGTDKSLFGNHA